MSPGQNLHVQRHILPEAAFRSAAATAAVQYPGPCRGSYSYETLVFVQQPAAQFPWHDSSPQTCSCISNFALRSPSGLETPG